MPVIIYSIFLRFSVISKYLVRLNYWKFFCTFPSFFVENWSFPKKRFVLHLIRVTTVFLWVTKRFELLIPCIRLQNSKIQNELVNKIWLLLIMSSSLFLILLNYIESMKFLPIKYMAWYWENISVILKLFLKSFKFRSLNTLSNLTIFNWIRKKIEWEESLNFASQL